MDEKTQATWSKLEIQSVARQEFDEPLKEIQKSIKECRNEAVTKSDLLDEELTEAIRSELPDVPSVFISAVSGYNLQTLKDMLWEALQKENA